MASQSIGVPETRVPKWPTMLRPTDFMRTGARGSPSWPEQLLRGRIHYGRLFKTNSAQIHLQIGGGPYIRYTRVPPRRPVVGAQTQRDPHASHNIRR